MSDTFSPAPPDGTPTETPAVSAAVMSSVDSSVLSASSMAAWNVYRPLVAPDASSARLTTVVKRVVIVVGITRHGLGWFKLFVPSGLNVFHTFNPARSVLDAAVLAGLLIAAAMALTVFSQASRRPAVSFSLLLFVIPLLPALYIPGVGENVFAERYLYLPSLGAALLLAWLAAAAVTQRPGLLPVLIAAFLVVAVVFSAGTVARNRVYKDDYTLWTDSVRKSPDAATPRYGLGYTLYAMGRTKEAIAELQQAVRLRDDVPKFHENLGNAYYRNGETDKAIEQYKAALALDPSNPLTWNRLGVAYGRAGRIPEAIRQFERALEIDPSCDSAYYNLGLALKTTP